MYARDVQMDVAAIKFQLVHLHTRYNEFDVVCTVHHVAMCI